MGLSNDHQTLESYGIKEDAYIKITFPTKRRHGKSKAATTNAKRRLKVKTKGGNPKQLQEDPENVEDQPNDDDGSHLEIPPLETGAEKPQDHFAEDWVDLTKDEEPEVYTLIYDLLS